MKLYPISTLLIALTLCACSNNSQTVDPAPQANSGGSMDSAGSVSNPGQTKDAAHAAADGGSMDSAGAAGKTPGVDLAGKVLETMQAGGYTYVRLDTGDKEVWAAGRTSKLEMGAQVIAIGLTPMRNFESPSLGRSFDTIYFCDAMQVTGAHASSGAATQEATIPVEVELAEGEQSVEQMFTEKDKFVGKQVSLHGTVVKFSANIMGKNWIHLQDGTGGAGTNDLTITTAQTVKVGDTVKVVGMLIADKDFGYGYKYALIIEDAKITVD